MPEQPPDDLVTAVAEVIARHDWSTTDVGGNPMETWEEMSQDERTRCVDYNRAAARAVLARTDLVLPAADVVPRVSVFALADDLRRCTCPESASMAYAADRLVALLDGGRS